MKRIAFASALALGAAGAASAAADCGEVSITEMDWASSAVVTYVSKFLMEQGYGCTVQVCRPPQRLPLPPSQKPVSPIW